MAPVRALSGELGPLSESKTRAVPERRVRAFVAICEGTGLASSSGTNSREQRRKLVAKICTEMEDNPARENRKSMVEKQAGESKAPRWRLCGSHRPAEPGGKTRNYGLFGSFQM